jgi:guanylate kinase
MRLEKAQIELNRAPEFDLIIENKELHLAVDNAYKAITTFLNL